MIEQAILVGLSSFLITFFMRDLDGPMEVFKRLRDFFTQQKDGKYRFPFFAGLYNCFYCFSTWVAILVTLLYAVLLPINALHVLPVFISGLGISTVLTVLLFER